MFSCTYEGHKPQTFANACGLLTLYACSGMLGAAELEWVSELWDNRRGAAAHVLLLGSCEINTEAVFNAFLEKLLPSVQASCISREIKSQVLPEHANDVSRSLKEKLKLVLEHAVLGTRLFFILEHGPGCVRQCLVLEFDDRQVKVSDCPRDRAVKAYREGLPFLLVDQARGTANLLSSSSSKGLVLDGRCWRALLEKHEPRTLAQGFEAKATRALLERARAALSRLET